MVSNFGFLPMHKWIDSIIFVRIISLVGFLMGLTCYEKYLANYLTLAASSFVSSGSLISKLWYRIMLALKMYISVTLFWCRCLLSMLPRMPQTWLQNYGLVTMLHKPKQIRSICQGNGYVRIWSYLSDLANIVCLFYLFGNFMLKRRMRYQNKQISL